MIEFIECDYKKQERKKMENKEIQNEEVAEVTESVEEIESADHEPDVEVNEEEMEEKVEKVKKPLTKHEESKALMKNAEMLVAKADKDVKDVEEIVIEHVSEFKAKKENLAESILAETKTLLGEANYEYSEGENNDEFELSLGSTKENVQIQNLGTGRFTGFILSLVGMAATAGAWLYVAAQKTGTAIDIEKMPEQSTIDTVFTWIGGGMTGSTGNPIFGMATVGLTSLFVGFLIYKMRVSLKENKNYKVANKALEQSQVYVEEQKESKTEMERIDQHILEATPLIESYAVILNEQNAKLKRVLHVEGSFEDMSEYHPNSKHLMDETENLIKRVEGFINSPVSKEGRFNEESVTAYREAKALYESYIAQTYA